MEHDKNGTKNYSNANPIKLFIPCTVNGVYLFLDHSSNHIIFQKF